ncbi:MAG: hypothetical protein ACLPKZ_01835 [Acidimicrobiales bacterium]
MAHSSPWRILRRPKMGRLAQTRVDPAIVNTIPRTRLDASFINGVWLHPTTVKAMTELEQWYDLEYRILVPHEGWPR